MRRITFVWDELGQTFFLHLLNSPSIKTGTKRIIRPDEVSTLVPLRRRTKLDSLSKPIMRLVPFYILDEFNRRKCLPTFVLDELCVSHSSSRLYTSRITRQTHNSSGRIMRLQYKNGHGHL